MFKELNLEDPAFHSVEKTIETTPSGTITAYLAEVQTPYFRCPEKLDESGKQVAALVSNCC